MTYKPPLTPAQLALAKRMALADATGAAIGKAIGRSTPAACALIRKFVDRPPRSRPGRQYPFFIGVRMKGGTYDRLDDRARGLGMTHSEYVRHLIDLAG